MHCVSLIWWNNNNNNNKNNSNTYNLQVQCSVWVAKISITKINEGVAIIKIEETLFQRESAIFNSIRCFSFFHTAEVSSKYGNYLKFQFT